MMSEDYKWSEEAFSQTPLKELIEVLTTFFTTLQEFLADLIRPFFIICGNEEEELLQEVAKKILQEALKK